MTDRPATESERLDRIEAAIRKLIFHCVRSKLDSARIEAVLVGDEPPVTLADPREERGPFY